jgi:hypothetical protein
MRGSAPTPRRDQFAEHTYRINRQRGHNQDRSFAERILVNNYVWFARDPCGFIAEVPCVSETTGRYRDEKRRIPVTRILKTAGQNERTHGEFLFCRFRSDRNKAGRQSVRNERR